MTHQAFRRCLALTLPLVFVIAACQTKAVAPTPAGDTNPVVSEKPVVEEVAVITNRCDQSQLVPPCQGEDVGSDCSPDATLVIDFPSNPEAPQLTWTYPCNPDGYKVSLWLGATNQELASTEITTFDPNVGGPTRSWTPDVHLYVQRMDYWYRINPILGDAPSPTGTTHFWVGPHCSAVVGPTFIPTLIAPAPYQQIYHPPAEPHVGYLHFWWQIPWVTPCLNMFDGELWLNETNPRVIPFTSSSPFDQEAWVDMYNLQCGEYLWRVRAKGTEAAGTWSETRSFLIEGGYCPTPQAHIVAEAMQAAVTQNAACRLGPSTAYGIAGYAAAGERHPAAGRNAAGTWVKLRDLGCYISRELLALDQGGTPSVPAPDVGELISALPILPDPPLPTPTPVAPACHINLNQRDCAAAGGSWVSYRTATGGLAYRCSCP